MIMASSNKLASDKEMKIKHSLSWIILLLWCITGCVCGWYLTSQQHKISEMEERYRLAIEGSAQGLWYWDVSTSNKLTATDDVWYSDHFLTMLGTTRDKFPPVLGSFLSRIHPDDFNRVQEHITHCFENGRITSVTYRLKMDCDKYIWVYTRATTDNVKHHLAGSIIDITNAVEQQRRAESIVESAPVAIITSDVDGTITLFNYHSTKLLGYSLEEVINKKITMFIPDDKLQQHLTQFKKAVLKLQTLDGNYITGIIDVPTTAKRKDGSEIPVLLSVRGIKYGDTVEFVAAMKTPCIEPESEPQKPARIQEVTRSVLVESTSMPTVPR